MPRTSRDCSFAVGVLFSLVSSASAFSTRIDGSSMHYLSKTNNLQNRQVMHLKNIDAADAVQKPHKRRRMQPSSVQPTTEEFWFDQNDECMFISGDSSNFKSKSVKFIIRGKPLPLIRHRSSRGFTYNPSSAAQAKFRDSLLQIMPQKHHPKIIDDCVSGDAPITFFSDSDFLEVSIVFRLKRPKSHFVNSTPGEGRIKDKAPGKFHTSRSDIDNLAKFVLDSLNGLLYADDRQVVSLKAMKMLDSEGLCDGATEVSISVLQDEKVNLE